MFKYIHILLGSSLLIFVATSTNTFYHHLYRFRRAVNILFQGNDVIQIKYLRTKKTLSS